MLASKTCTVDGDANSFSVRRFASFGLLETKLCSEETEVDEQHSDNVTHARYYARYTRLNFFILYILTGA